jgi:Na+-translocating ferredoxin:NAD+ oxidoreductase RnfE subunit
VSFIHIILYIPSVQAAVVSTGAAVGAAELQGQVRLSIYILCITIIDTIILHTHTNDAYTYDTYTCITIIDTIILTNYTNDANTYDTGGCEGG